MKTRLFFLGCQLIFLGFGIGIRVAASVGDGGNDLPFLFASLGCAVAYFVCRDE